MTSTERMRGLFLEYMESSGYRKELILDGCLTIDQDRLLKYERIDKYRVLFLTQKDLKNIIRFSEKHGISIWFGGDKLCVGFNCRQNICLTKYDSVALRSSPGPALGDRNYLSVIPEKMSCDQSPDRIEHHLDVHGGLD